MGKLIDLTDKQLSKYIKVISREESLIKNRKTYARWKIHCSLCGKDSIKLGQNLNKRDNETCGCVHHNQTHGESLGYEQSRIYIVYRNMLLRCYNKNTDNYERYGALGITVCERWLKSFENFFEDMGNPPTEIHTIDRKDGSKGYYKDNCCWSTPTEQAKNRKSNIHITYDGVTKIMSDWADENNIDRCKFRYWHLKGLNLQEIIDKVSNNKGTRHE